MTFEVQFEVRMELWMGACSTLEETFEVSLGDVSIKRERHEAVLRPPQGEVSPLKIITAMPAALSPRRAAFVVFGIELHLNDSHSFKY